ncbi:MAG: FUSC family protein, partial [Ochrobactrum anthropi]
MSVRSIVTTDTVVFSLKTFLAAMLAYFIAISFDLPRPFWAVATVYIVAHPLSVNRNGIFTPFTCPILTPRLRISTWPARRWPGLQRVGQVRVISCFGF